MSKENLDAAVLEEGVEVTSEATEGKETKPKKEKKVYTEEEVAALSNAVAVIVESAGVTPEVAKVLEMVPLWHDIDANEATKTQVAEFFGGVDKMKTYFDTDFQAELALLEAFQAVGSRIKLINSFYKRRETTGTKVSKASRNISIDGEVYTINKAYYESISELSGDEKKELLLAHPMTKKFAEDIEAL